jgi:acyl carrier protein
MSGSERHARVRSFVTSALRYPDLADTDDIFEVGGATSLFAAQLVVFVEDEIGIELEDDDLVRENFATIRDICDLADRRARPR